jgi:tetratricopeptide (TPR) repeat protein
MPRIFKKVTLIATVFVLFLFASGYAQDLQQAIKLVKSEQFAAASSMFKKLVAQDPNNGDIYHYFGASFIRRYYTDTVNNSLSEVSDSAQLLFKLGAQKDPSNPLNYVGEGWVALMNNDQADAKTDYAKALALLPSKANKSIVMDPKRQAQVLFRMARGYVLTGVRDTTNVFNLLRQAEKLDPKNPELYITMGDAYILTLNDGSKAIANYNKAQALDPKSPEAKLQIGLLWMRARQYQYALDTYQEVIKIDSTFAPAYRELGYLLTRAGRNAEAEKNYKIFLRLSGGNTNARIQYVNILIELKNYQEAIRQLNEVFRVDSSNNDLNRAAAYCYFETAQYDKGLQYSRKFFKNAPKDKIRPADYAYLGRLLAKTKQDSLASAMLMKAFTLDSSKGELLSEAAMSLNKLKKYNQALEIYNMKVSLNKATPNDYYNMGKVYYNLRNYPKVDSVLGYYTTLMPDHIQGYLWRARALVNIDSTAKLGLAKPVYESMIEKARTDSVKNVKELTEAYSYLAYYYLVLYKDTKDQANGLKSIEYCYKVLAIEPQDPAFADKAKAILKDLESKIKTK